MNEYILQKYYKNISNHRNFIGQRDFGKSTYLSLQFQTKLSDSQIIFLYILLFTTLFRRIYMKNFNNNERK